MEKTSHEMSYEFRSPVLYYDDLLDLVAVLKNYSEVVEIRDADYRYDDLEEFKKENPSPVNRLMLSIDDPEIRVSLRNNVCYVTSGNDDIESKSALLEVNSIITKREHKRSLFLNLYTGFALYLMTLTLAVKYVDFKYSFYTLLGIGAVFIPVGAWLQKKHVGVTIIHTQKRCEVKGFFQRNRDTLLVNLVVVLLTAFLSIGGTLLVQHFTTDVEQTPISTTSNATSPAPDKPTSP